MKNGQIWKDVDGNNIQAHGGCILEYEGTFYWYGENKGVDNCPNTTRVDVIGVSCYTSKNLVDWEYKGLVIESNKDDPENPLHYSRVLERPKVIYNEKTRQFVLWMHLDSADYFFASVGVAVSESPLGPFKLIKVMRPNRQESRDMTIYKDVDDVAYIIYSKDYNATLNVARLNTDYTDVDGLYVSAMIDQTREAPAVFYNDGIYYMITSGCTGWKPNPALFSQSDYMLGKWKIIDNPCRGENADTTFFGQSAFVFNTKGKFYLMLDHWIANDLKNSGYSILPIEFNADKTIIIPWKEDWEGI